MDAHLTHCLPSLFLRCYHHVLLCGFLFQKGTATSLSSPTHLHAEEEEREVGQAKGQLRDRGERRRFPSSSQLKESRDRSKPPALHCPCAGCCFLSSPPPAPLPSLFQMPWHPCLLRHHIEEEGEEVCKEGKESSPESEKCSVL